MTTPTPTATPQTLDVRTSGSIEDTPRQVS